MKPLNKEALLKYTSQLGLMLLSEVGIEVKGRRPFRPSDVPFNEKRALLAELNRTLMVLTKVNPEKEESGLDAMRGLLNGSPTPGNSSRKSNGSARTDEDAGSDAFP